MTKSGPDKYPIAVGSMLFTLVDPSHGHEVAYNRWYERDHFYAGCMTGPYCFSGSRWVATQELKKLRFPADATNGVTRPWDSGSYLAVYWVEAGHHADQFVWAADQVVRLYSDGRGFDERQHAHTALYAHVEDVYRDDDPVPVELALDHGYASLVTVAVEREDGGNAAELGSWMLDEGLPPVLEDGPVASCAIWTPVQFQEDTTRQAPMDLGTSPGGGGRTMQLFFLEEEPAKSWDRFVDYGRRVNKSGLATAVFAAPFLATVVGTDAYSDELW